MTTIENKLQDELFQCGLFEDQAKEIIERIKTDKANKSMNGRWTDLVDDYPPVMFAVLWMIAKRHALEWIKENKPNAWCRPLFEDESET